MLGLGGANTIPSNESSDAVMDGRRACIRYPLIRYFTCGEVSGGGSGAEGKCKAASLVL